MSTNHPKGNKKSSGVGGLVASFFTALARDLLQMIMAFLIGTGATAAICWYYDVPLFLSLFGGILVLGVSLALKSDSLFD